METGNYDTIYSRIIAILPEDKEHVYFKLVYNHTILIYISK